jgi:hypothetical protein
MLQRVASELHTHTQTSLEIVIPLLLGVAAFGCQGRFNVAFPDGRSSPLTVFITLVARPVTGKSTVLTRLLQPINRAEEQLNEKAEDPLDDEAEKSDSTEAAEPEAPREPQVEAKPRQLLYDNVTPEGLASNRRAMACLPS